MEFEWVNPMPAYLPALRVPRSDIKKFKKAFQTSNNSRGIGGCRNRGPEPGRLARGSSDEKIRQIYSAAVLLG